jgi:hypothetical protein
VAQGTGIHLTIASSPAAKMSPKRGIFSLNINSETEHFDKHVDKHFPDGEESVKVIDTQPKSYTLGGFEKIVNNAVDDVIKDTGKKVDRVEGDLHYTSTATSSGHTNNHTTSSSSSNIPSDSNLNVKNKSTRRYLERRYDTSDL